MALAAAAAAVLVLRGGDSGQPTPAPTSDRLAALSRGELAGQRLIAGYDGTEPPAGLERMIRRGELAGVIVFADNVGGDPDRLERRTGSLQRLAERAGTPPLLVMTDQEGGAVARLPGPPAGSASELGELGADRVREQGRRTGELLRAAGINVDLAPVLDLGRTDGAIAAEGRSFAPDPDRVAELGLAFAAGLREAGVAATAKHFPGLGGAGQNTDVASERIGLTAERLRAEDIAPFAAFAAAGGELVMSSLAVYPALDRDRPAGLSPAVIEGELRDRLGFEGVTITDSLEAAAARAFGPPARVARAAAAAGNDLLLYPDWRAARVAGRVLTAALERGELERAQFADAAGRVLALREQLGAGRRAGGAGPGGPAVDRAPTARRAHTIGRRWPRP